ncbi:DUF6795 domain-containing protein [Shewanella sp. MF05960]|uniref:DUF6795 domain-containing protein n=1 Tax=Shewanella sp. MF05960 TaxID=3434874 RepID=UPI003D797A2C
MFGLLKTYDVHMCSEVKGQVLVNGKPVVGAKVTRQLKYIHKFVENDETRTDENGEFSMPEVNLSSKKPGDMFVHNFTEQQIELFHDGKSYLLWRSSVIGIEESPEVKEKLATLNADLTSKEVDFTFPNKRNRNLEFDGSSICRWETDFDVYELNDDEEDFFNF